MKPLLFTALALLGMWWLCRVLADQPRSSELSGKELERYQRWRDSEEGQSMIKSLNEYQIERAKRRAGWEKVEEE